MQNNPKRQEKLTLVRPLQTRRHFVHPTIAPLMIGVFLYSGFSLFGRIFQIHYPEWIQHGLFLTVAFCMGVSGTIILKRGKVVEKTGIIKRSWYAYAIGIGCTIFGFGTALFGLYSYFIK
jgi:hypothetical protein